VSHQDQIRKERRGIKRRGFVGLSTFIGAAWMKKGEEGEEEGGKRKKISSRCAPSSSLTTAREGEGKKS